MDIWNINDFMLFLIFFIPGFISIKIYDLLIPSERRDFSVTFIEAIGYSAINFGLLSWLILIIHSNNFYSVHRTWYVIFLVVILFIFPALLPIIFKALLSWKPITKHVIHPIPKPWDYVFGKGESYWIIIHLKNGKMVGGVYDEQSFASSFPAEEQIYLEKVWKINEEGVFLEQIDRSEGIIVTRDEISSVEFFK